ncbi:GNAT family N-acetyltransferase [Aeromonas allosaccharophila]
MAIKSDHKRSLFYIYFNWLPLKILYMNAAYWRRGFMSEALGLLFAHASTLGVTRLTADIDADNVRSIALFKKLGFKAHAGRYQRMLPFV